MTLPPIESIKDPLGCNGECILRKLVIPVHHFCDAHLAYHLRILVVGNQCVIELWNPSLNLRAFSEHRV